MAKKLAKHSTDKHVDIQHFPPVITVLGHVDHGKTTLLDAIRKTSHVKTEFGGITQKIGASSVVIPHEKQLRKLTFLDTPGHEAFTKMRSRGARVADIGLLIVSSVDGVMPQTKESISILKESGMPFIVVLTMSDMETKNPEKVKQQLIKEEVMLEGYGGDIPVIEVSARANKNIQELLDLILLVFDMKAGGMATSKAPLEAIVIESRLDQKAGPKASVVIRNGTLNARDEIVCEGIIGKVRSLQNEKGEVVKSATVGDAVEILGFTSVPAVGGIITHKGAPAKVSQTPAESQAPLTREMVYKKEEVQAPLSLVLAADTQGSLEAITYALPKGVVIISQKTGEITENDIFLAKSTGALVLGFNSKMRPDVLRLAQTEKVLAKNYQIIYEMLDEIKDVLEGKRLAGVEQVYGVAKVQALFPFDKQLVLGVVVVEGRVARGDKIRVERGEETIIESTIASLRSGKNQVSKIEQGQEAGVILQASLDFHVGDMIICHG